MPPASPRALARLYRVADWLHFLPLPLAGFVAADRRDPVALAAGTAGWALGLAYTSAINQAFDDRVDRARPGKNPVGSAFRRAQAVRLALPPLALSLLVVGLAAPHGLPAAVALAVAATLYSAPPRLKRFPVVGTLWNVVIGVPGLFFAERPDILRPPLGLLVASFALLLVVSQLIHEAEDRDDDRQGAVATVATIAGARGALAAAAALLATLPVAAWTLSAGLTLRVPIAAGSAAFASAWLVILGARVASGDESRLREVRLRYRVAALAFGAALFAAALPRP